MEIDSSSVWRQEARKLRASGQEIQRKEWKMINPLLGVEIDTSSDEIFLNEALEREESNCRLADSNGKKVSDGVAKSV